jgi:hypothetical protein
MGLVAAMEETDEKETAYVPDPDKKAKVQV